MYLFRSHPRKKKQNMILEKERYELDKRIDAALIQHEYRLATLPKARPEMWGKAIQHALVKAAPSSLMAMLAFRISSQQIFCKTALQEYCQMQIDYIMVQQYEAFSAINERG